MPKEFKGFTPRAEAFYTDLMLNNGKEWFEEHRAEYETQVLAPARAFVEAMGRALAGPVPGIQAIPLVNRSLFRINRDVRFSKDKSPYKTHLGLWMWEGPWPRMECSGFYFHLEPGEFLLGGGMYMFPQHLLDPYRRAVDQEKTGAALVGIVDRARKEGLSLGGEAYKRVPRGFAADHPRAGLLRYKGLTLYKSFPAAPPEILDDRCVDFCLDYFLKMLPLHRWLVDLTLSAAKDRG